jgi:hypothetical protein
MEDREGPRHGYPFENKIQTAMKIKAASVLTK